MSKTFERKGKHYTYREKKYEKDDNGRFLNKSIIASASIHDNPTNFPPTARIYARKYHTTRKIEKHEEQQTNEISLRTDPIQLQTKRYTDEYLHKPTKQTYLKYQR